MTRGSGIGAVEASLAHRLLDGVGRGLALLDDGGGIRLANRAAEGLFGYGPGELDGCALADLYPAEGRRAGAPERALAVAIRPLNTGLTSFMRLQIAATPMAPAPRKRTWVRHTVTATVAASPGIPALRSGVATPQAMMRPTSIAKPASNRILIILLFLPGQGIAEIARSDRSE